MLALRMIGAEPIFWKTLKAFEKKFASYGLARILFAQAMD